MFQCVPCGFSLFSSTCFEDPAPMGIVGSQQGAAVIGGLAMRHADKMSKSHGWHQVIRRGIGGRGMGSCRQPSVTLLNRHWRDPDRICRCRPKYKIRTGGLFCQPLPDRFFVLILPGKQRLMGPDQLASNPARHGRKRNRHCRLFFPGGGH